MSKQADRSLESTRLRNWLVSRLWMVGLALALTLGGLFLSGHRQFFVPGTTSDGHHLLEPSCNSCHKGFAPIANDDCVSCHRPELASDTHPVRTFDDPRWASDLKEINALRCVTCHHEHKVAAGGVTIRREFCYPCHDDVVAKRASHKDLSPSSCGDAGCHNYHDNSGLNTAVLTAALGQPDQLAEPAVLARRLVPEPAGPHLAPDAPAGVTAPAALVQAWDGSVHRRAGVGCSDCHGKGEAFALRPGFAACKTCHGFEVDTFGAGQHGVRTRLDLEPLRPADARSPMAAGASRLHPEHGCGSCHDVHSVDTRHAATEACLDCHADRHSLAFGSSPHARGATQLDPHDGRAVTCATCHLPRVEVEEKGAVRVATNHNNSLTMRPIDRMARLVCNRCHGYELSLASLLDPQAGASNFAAKPSSRARSFLMVEAARLGRQPEGGGR